MKKYYLLLLFVTSFMSAQIVNIPDANFKAKLLSAHPSNYVAFNGASYVKIDINDDGEIQLAEALAITKLNVDGADINNLLGLETFTNLTEFSSINNPITEINLVSLTNLNSLIVVNAQLTILDISSLVNLTTLNCGGNNLLMLDVSNLFSLTSLNCVNNEISTLNLASLTNLTSLIVNNNNLPDLNLSTLINLQYLSCGSNPLSQLNLSGLVNLTDLNCASNPLGTIDLTPVPNLSVLYCGGTNLTNLSVSTLSNLTKLDCENNMLSTLDLTGMNNLLEVNASGNQLLSIDVSGCTNIKSLDVSFNDDLPLLDVGGLQMLELLDCSFGNLNSLNVDGCISMKKIDCSSNELTSVDLSTLENLQVFNSSQNLFVELDFSNCPMTQLYSYGNAIYIEQFSASNNPNLVYINLKNGTSFNNGANQGAFGSLPSLEYVCLDDAEVGYLSNLISSTVNINTYCSFTPGGNYNIISGLMTYDANSNGCDVNDLGQSNIKVNINDGTNQGATFTSNVGNYSFFTQAGSYSLTPNFENPNYFNVSPNPTTVNFAENDNSTIIQNFCITPNGIHPDLEVVLVPVIPARPGFDAVYKIVYKNKGNQTVNGMVFFGFNYAYLDFVSAVPAQNNGTAGYYGFNLTNLAPFETRSILVTLNINAPTETNAVNIGDVLEFDANIIITSGSTAETETDDNIFYLNQTVVGSFDPNDITCLQGNALPLNDIGKYMHYNIRFENTGTYAAENIVVKNTIDLTQYDIQSLQVMESSHPVTVKVIGNIAEFIFQGIDLDTGGHGNILLKLKSNATLADDLVINSADIFFDYNFPIVTNDEQTVFADLSKNDFNKDVSIKVYPNPAESEITIKAENTINSIQLFDVQGRLLQTKLSNQNTESVDLSNYSSGIYFVTVSTTAGKQTHKISKK